MARFPHWIALVVLGVLAAGAAGCGGFHTPYVTNCGYPYVFTLPDGHQVVSGDCPGLVLPKPPAVAVRRGETFSVLIAHDQGDGLVVPVPEPSGLSVEIVSEDQASGRVTYRAAEPGRVVLVAHHTRLCLGIDPKVGSCPALAVTVVG